jgi:hypothetical protein
LKSAVSSLSRTLDDRKQVGLAICTRETKATIKPVTDPNSRAKTIRAAGIALCVAPDPITDVPGVALIASSYLLKDKEPADLKSIHKELAQMFKVLGSVVS